MAITKEQAKQIAADRAAKRKAEEKKAEVARVAEETKKASTKKTFASVEAAKKKKASQRKTRPPVGGKASRMPLPSQTRTEERKTVSGKAPRSSLPPQTTAEDSGDETAEFVPPSRASVKHPTFGGKTPRSHRKKAARKSNSSALREIRKYQRSTDLLLLKRPFRDLLKEDEIGGKFTPDGEGAAVDVRYQATAVLTLQEALETFLVGFFEDANLVAINSRRVTVSDRDLNTVKEIRNLL